MTKNPSGWTTPPPPDTPPPAPPAAQSPMVMHWRTGSREELAKCLKKSSDELYRVLFKTLVSYGHGREVPTVAMLTALLDVAHDLLINSGQLWAEPDFVAALRKIAGEEERRESSLGSSQIGGDFSQRTSTGLRRSSSQPPPEIDHLRRYGHRDATMILMAFRHGPAGLGAGRLHVRRVKRFS
jgi:hypothetical protein